MRQQPMVPRQGRWQDTIDVNRIGNILQTAFADVLERNFDDLANLIVDGLRDANSSRLGQLFQPSCNIHASSIPIVIFGNYIAQIDTDAELIRSVSGTDALRPPISFWISMAQRRASTTLGNSATSRPPHG